MWSKELKECEGIAAREIGHLRRMLAELGMTGRMSMEQARAIREKRELAKEMGTLLLLEWLFSIADGSLQRMCVSLRRSLRVDGRSGVVLLKRENKRKRKWRARARMVVLVSGDQR